MEQKKIINNYDDYKKVIVKEGQNQSNNDIQLSKNKKICVLFYFIIFLLIGIIILFTFPTLNTKQIFQNNKNLKSNSFITYLKSLTNKDLFLYKGVKNCLFKDPDKELCIYQFLCPKEVRGKKRVLIGEKKDGCYVMIDDFEDIKIAYSIGISYKIQFDITLANKGIDVYMYDHTINKLPIENKKFHWYKIGLGGNLERNNNIQTLEDMIKNNGHLEEKNMILKIDIESAEWNALNDISEKTLNQFKYILIEFHFFKDNHELYYNVLKKIYKTHQVFYVHCCPMLNLSTFGNNKICKGIEVSYIIRNGNTFTRDKSIYPVPEFSYGYNKDFNVNILKLFDEYNPA